MDFLRAGQSVRLRLVRDVAETWGLRASDASGPPSVSSEELFFSEAFARATRNVAEHRRLETMISRLQKRLEQFQKEKAAWEAEKEELCRQLEEAQVKARTEAAVSAERAAKAEERGERRGRKRGHGEARDFYRKVLITLATDFIDDEYYDAYLKYVEDREKAIAEGRDPNEVEFPLATAEDTPQKEGGEAVTREEETNPNEVFEAAPPTP